MYFDLEANADGFGGQLVNATVLAGERLASNKGAGFQGAVFAASLVAPGLYAVELATDMDVSHVGASMVLVTTDVNGQTSAGRTVNLFGAQASPAVEFDVALDYTLPLPSGQSTRLLAAAGYQPLLVFNQSGSTAACLATKPVVSFYFDLDYALISVNDSTFEYFADLVHVAVIDGSNMSASELLDVGLSEGSVVASATLNSAEAALLLHAALARGDVFVDFNGGRYVANPVDTTDSSSTNAVAGWQLGLAVAVVVVLLLVLVLLVVRQRRKNSGNELDILTNIQDLTRAPATVSRSRLKPRTSEVQFDPMVQNTILAIGSPPRRDTLKFYQLDQVRSQAGAESDELVESTRKVNPLNEELDEPDRLAATQRDIGRSALSFASLMTGDANSAPGVRRRGSQDQDQEPAAEPQAAAYQADADAVSKWRYATNDEIANNIRKLSLSLAASVQGSASNLRKTVSRPSFGRSPSISQARDAAVAKKKAAQKPSDESVGYATIMHARPLLVAEETDDEQTDVVYASLLFEQVNKPMQFGVSYLGAKMLEQASDELTPGVLQEAIRYVTTHPRERSNERCTLYTSADGLQVRNVSTLRRRGGDTEVHEYPWNDTVAAEQLDRYVGLVVQHDTQNVCYVYKCRDDKKAFKLLEVAQAHCRKLPTAAAQADNDFDAAISALRHGPPRVGPRPQRAPPMLVDPFAQAPAAEGRDLRRVAFPTTKVAFSSTHDEGHADTSVLETSTDAVHLQDEDAEATAPRPAGMRRRESTTDAMDLQPVFPDTQGHETHTDVHHIVMHEEHDDETELPGQTEEPFLDLPPPPDYMESTADFGVDEEYLAYLPDNAVQDDGMDMLPDNTVQDDEYNDFLPDTSVQDDDGMGYLPDNNVDTMLTMLDNLDLPDLTLSDNQ